MAQQAERQFVSGRDSHDHRSSNRFVGDGFEGPKGLKTPTQVVAGGGHEHRVKLDQGFITLLAERGRWEIALALGDKLFVA